MVGFCEAGFLAGYAFSYNGGGDRLVRRGGVMMHDLIYERMFFDTFPGVILFVGCLIAKEVTITLGWGYDTFILMVACICIVLLGSVVVPAIVEIIRLKGEIQ